MDTNNLVFALKISGIGIVVLLLVLVLLAVVVWLMTKFIVEKPEKESVEEPEKVGAAATVEPKTDLQLAAAVALALYRAQTETQSVGSAANTGEINPWKQFNLQRRLTQSSNIRRTK